MIVGTFARRTSAGLPNEPTMDGPAELPRSTVSTTFPTVTGTTRTVSNDNASGAGSMAQALTDAVGGDEIVITVNLTRTINLPNRGENGWVLIRSDNAAWQSASSTRITATTNMRSVTAAGSPLRAMTVSDSAHHYYFCGINFKMPSGDATGVKTSLMSFGSAATTTGQLPTDLIFDRCYLNGDATNGGRRAASFNVVRGAFVHCYFKDWKEDGADNQCFLVSNTPGPLLIHNNFLEGAGENIMFGGTDPQIADCVPSDITITQNHFYKPLLWRDTETQWDVKNLIEIKNAQRVLIEKNSFENMWSAAQDDAIKLKSVNQNGTADWCTCSDIVFRHNKVYNVHHGFAMVGIEEPVVGYTSVGTYRIRFRNNLFEMVPVAGSSYDGTIGYIHYLSMVHNTYVHPNNNSAGVFYNGAGVEGVGGEYHTIQDNIFSNSTNGFDSGYTTEGTNTINGFSPATYTFSYNAVTGRNAVSGNYPASNIFPANDAAISYTSLAGGDYTLNGGPCVGTASDSGDMGCDVAAVEAYATTAEAGS